MVFCPDASSTLCRHAIILVVTISNIIRNTAYAENVNINMFASRNNIS